MEVEDFIPFYADKKCQYYNMFYCDYHYINNSISCIICQYPYLHKLDRSYMCILQMTVLRFHIKALPIISEELQPVDEKDNNPPDMV